MNIEETYVLSPIKVNASGKLRLFISDHLEWEPKDREHELLLWRKMSVYCTALEDTAFWDHFSLVNGKGTTIVVLGLYPLTNEAERFYDLTRSVLPEGIGLDFRYQPVDRPTRKIKHKEIKDTCRLLL
jgi:hypothetical protein